MPAGRPSEYREEFCEQVIELGREGKSRAEIAADLDICRTTLWNWEQAHPEFMKALQRAKDMELAWWESQSREGLNKGSAFNAALWGRAVSGRFPSEPYRERVEHTGKDGGPIETNAKVDLSALTPDQLRAIASIKLPADG